MKLPQNVKSTDDIQTPAYALNPLLPYIPKEWIIWECACGKKNLSNEFLKRGNPVWSTDILTGKDFLTQPIRCNTYDCIVTNPPYSLKQQFLEQAYSLEKPFAFLLPLTTFETAKRQRLFKEYGLEVIFFDKRINFNFINGDVFPTWFATAWFTFGLNIGKEMTFVELDKSQLKSSVINEQLTIFEP